MEQRMPRAGGRVGFEVGASRARPADARRSVAGEHSPRMTTPNDYIQAFAVIRVNGETMDSDARVAECEIDGKMQPTAGPANITG